jgi:hypothetical protein
MSIGNRKAEKKTNDEIAQFAYEKQVGQIVDEWADSELK